MEIGITYVWLLAGVFFFFLEAMGISGIGFMFAGLGALSVGTALNLGWVSSDAIIAQLIIFFISTAVWTAALWAPLKKYRKKHPPVGYSNMVGETAYVGSSGITKRDGGEVTWSGTIMKAKLVHDAAVDYLEAGSQVTIVSVSGVTLTVKPKN